MYVRMLYVLIMYVFMYIRMCGWVDGLDGCAYEGMRE